MSGTLAPRTTKGWRIEALIAGTFLALVAGAALLAPTFAWALGADPNVINTTEALRGSSASHWLGTDALGRDLFVRLLAGGRVSLTIAGVATVLTAGIGLTVGTITGFFGGALDAGLMRIADAVMSIPSLPVIMLILAVGGASSGIPGVVAAVVFFSWPAHARIVRSVVRRYREAPFVLAARATGVRPVRVALRHIAPFTLAPMTVAASAEFAQVILFESVLSYLGFGIVAPQASWGTMLRGGLAQWYERPALLIWPGLLCFACALAAHRLGAAISKSAATSG